MFLCYVKHFVTSKKSGNSTFLSVCCRCEGLDSTDQNKAGMKISNKNKYGGGYLEEEESNLVESAASGKSPSPQPSRKGISCPTLARMGKLNSGSRPRSGGGQICAQKWVLCLPETETENREMTSSLKCFFSERKTA